MYNAIRTTAGTLLVFMSVLVLAQTPEWKRLSWGSAKMEAVLSYDPASVVRLPRAVVIATRVEVPIKDSGTTTTWYEKIAYGCRNGRFAAGFTALTDNSQIGGLRWKLNDMNISGWGYKAFFQVKNRELIAMLKARCKEAPPRRSSDPFWFPAALSNEAVFYIDLVNVAVTGVQRTFWVRKNEGTSESVQSNIGKVVMFYETMDGAHTISNYQVNCTASSLLLLRYTEYGAGENAPVKGSHEVRDPEANTPSPGSIGRGLIDFGCGL